MLAYHIPCPEGRNCDETKESSNFLRLNLENNQLLQRETLPMGIFAQDAFQSKIVNEKLFFIRRTFSSGQVCSIPVQVGNVTNLYPTEGTLFEPSLGTIDEVSKRIFVYDDRTYLVNVFNENLVVQSTLDPFHAITSLSEIQVDSKRGYVYVGGMHTIDKMWRLTRYEFTNNVWLNQSIALGSFEQQFFLSKVIPHPNGHVYVSFENRTREVENFLVDDQTFLLQVSLDMKIVKRIDFNMKIISGYFYEPVSDTMYLYGNSDLTKITNSGKEGFYNGTMNLRYSWKRHLVNERKNNLVVSSAILYSETVALLGTEGWGMFLKVDLTKFIKKGDDFPSDTLAIVGLFVSIGVSLCIIVVLFSTIFLFICIKRSRKDDENQEKYQQVME